MKRLSMAICSLVLLSTMAGAGDLGSWYVRGGGGYVEHKFEPGYIDVGETEVSSRFTDMAYGMEASFAAGYQFKLIEKLSLAVQLRGGINDAEWTLDLPDEPAHFVYEIPYTYTFSLVPAVELVAGLGVFAEVGVGQGYIHQEKDSPADSSYDECDWRTAYTWAAGLTYKAMDRWSVFVEYRKSCYDDYTFDSHFPDGTLAETISDEPSSEIYSAGVSYEF